jgi:hypothetical protein
MAHKKKTGPPEGTNLAINPPVAQSNSQILITRTLSVRIALRSLPPVATDGTLIPLSDLSANVFEQLLPRPGL